MNYFETIRDLAKVAMPAGFEEPQAAAIAQLAKPFCDEITSDIQGNLICHKKGPGEKIMISAHMDVPGFMAMICQKDGLVRFAPMGHPTAADLQHCRVVTESGVSGVIRCEAKDGSAKPSSIKSTDLFLDLGVSTAEEAEKLAPAGSLFRLQPWATQLAGRRFMTPYANDLAGCAVLLDVMERLGETEYDVYFVFSVRELEGQTGAACAAWQIKPQQAIVVDCVRTGDEPASPKDHYALKMGGGAGIKMKEQAFLSSPQVTLALRETAKKAGIKWQMDIKGDGLTDASKVQRVDGGIFTSGVSIPCRGESAPVQVLDEGDLEQCANLLLAYLED
jgi:endoglucanase